MSSQLYGGPPRLRRFAVTVDGVRHEVIVEELDTGETSTAPSGPAATPASHAPGPHDGLAEDGWVTAPMPGTVTEIAVQPGDTVAQGDVLLILTAMKLENEISSPASGVVREVRVGVGDNVHSEDRLVQLQLQGADS